MISQAQIFLLSLAILAAGVAVLWFRQRKIGPVTFLLWIFLWTGFAVVVLFPEASVDLAHLLGIGRGVDLALYLGMILIFFILFRIYVRLEQVDQQMTQIIRAVALREAGLEPRDEAQSEKVRPVNKK